MLVFRNGLYCSQTLYVRCVADSKKNLEERYEVTEIQLPGPGMEGVSHERRVEHGVLEGGVVGMVTIDVGVNE